MEKPTDRIGTEILFENSRVRVWDMTLAPGEATELHKHDQDYLFVYVTGHNKLEIETQAGGTISTEAGDGNVTYWEVGAHGPPPSYIHRAKDAGPNVHRQILVELLGPSAAEEPSGPIGNGR